MRKHGRAIVQEIQTVLADAPAHLPIFCEDRRRLRPERLPELDVRRVVQFRRTPQQPAHRPAQVRSGRTRAPQTLGVLTQPRPELAWRPSQLRLE